MKTIKVGLGTCGVSAGGEKIYDRPEKRDRREKIQVMLETGCKGNCYQEAWWRSSTKRAAATCTAT